EFAAPLLKLGPHVAPIGVHFYRGNMFPAEYKNRLFIAEKGSWNKTDKIGFRVTMVTLAPGRPPQEDVVAEGGMQSGAQILGGAFGGRRGWWEGMREAWLWLGDV